MPAKSNIAQREIAAWNEWVAAQVEEEDAARKAHHAMVRAFPVGAVVTYRHGSQYRRGRVVLLHSYLCRLLLEHAESPSDRYWMNASRVLPPENLVDKAAEKAKRAAAKGASDGA